MKIFISGIILFFITLAVNAQNSISSFEQLRKTYQYSSSEEKAKLDSTYQYLEQNLKDQQVKDIGGISFGISRDIALELLKNKYGEPVNNPTSTTISFNNIKYAGYDFDSVHFLFQSDGINSYFNSCIFILNAKTKKEAIEKQEFLYKALYDKYNMFKSETEDGFYIYCGGVSPLWDGHWYNLKTDFYAAVSIDIIQFEQYLVDVYGYKYSARLVYGPFNYIKEEF